MSDVTRRKFVTTAAVAGAAITVVPRHVLGRGFQAPSDTVNLATVGVEDQRGRGAHHSEAPDQVEVVLGVDLDVSDAGDDAGDVLEHPAGGPARRAERRGELQQRGSLAELVGVRRGGATR